MILYKIILLVTLTISLYANGTKIIADSIEIVQPNQMTIQGQIEHYSELYNVDSALVSKVIQCESDGKHDGVIGDSGLSYGIFQFQRATFNRMAKLYGENLNYESQYDQLKLGIWAMSKPELAREWTSWVAIQKGGTYSFWSSQMQRHYTVKCKL